MNGKVIPSLPAHQRLRVGQNVRVNHRESWVAATVTSLAPRSVEVSFHGSVLAPLAGAVSPWAVRPADGVILRPVRQVGAGDEVVAADGTTRTVAAPPWRGRDGWMVLHFTDGGPSVLPPGAVLRLADNTPTVTVNGAPIGY